MLAGLTDILSEIHYISVNIFAFLTTTEMEQRRETCLLPFCSWCFCNNWNSSQEILVANPGRQWFLRLLAWPEPVEKVNSEKANSWNMGHSVSAIFKFFRWFNAKSYEFDLYKWYVLLFLWNS